MRLYKYLIISFFMIFFVFYSDSIADESHKYITQYINENISESDYLESRLLGLYDKLESNNKNILTKIELESVEPVIVNTYDLNNGQLDGPSEILSEKGDFTIVKFYQMRDNITDVIMPLSFYIVKNNVRYINIIDEQEYNNFKLIDYFTSNSESLELDDSNDYYDLKSQLFTNGITGGEPGEIDLTDKEDNTLYLLYEYQPINKDFTITRVYKSGNQIENIEVENLQEKPAKNLNVEKTGYKLSSYILSEVSGQPISTLDDLNMIGNLEINDKNKTNIELNSKTKSVYLVYDKLEYGVLKLYSNELSHKYSLSDLVGKENLLSVYDYVPSASEGNAYIPDCVGHFCGDANCTELHKCYSHQFGSKMLDPNNNYWTVSVDDTYNYNANTTFIKDYTPCGELTKTHITDWKGGNGDKAKIFPDSKFILYRQSDRDLVTLYPNKNNEISDKLLSIGLDVNTDSNYIPYGRRAAQETFTDESYYNRLETHWEDGADRKTDLTWRWKIWCDYGFEESSDIYHTKYETGHSPSDLNNYYSSENNVEQNYYIGKSGESLLKPDIDDYYECVNAGEKLSFYPYYAMTLENNDGTSDTVYVTSENISSIQLYDLIKTNILKRKSIELKSLPYFNHELEDTEDVGLLNHILTNISNLKINNQLKITMYLPCLPDELLDSVNSLGFRRSETETRSLIEDKLNYMLAKEEFQTLDQEKINSIISVSLYTLKSDVFGNYWVEKDGKIIGDKSNALDTLLLNEEIKLLDDNTKIVTNLWNALEHSENTFDRNGNKWYFEAFDGVSVYFVDYNLYY